MIIREGKVTSMSYNKYPKEMKDSIIARLVSGEETVTDMQRDTGVGINTIVSMERPGSKSEGIIGNDKV